MAQFESQGQLQEFLGILRKRSWQVILPAALVVSMGTAFAVIVPKKYLVGTQLELRNTETADLIANVRSAPYQLRSIERVRKVIRDLKWVDYLTLPPEYHAEYLRDVQEMIQVRTTRGGDQTAFVTIEYKNVNPKRAGSFLRTLRDAWIKDVIDRGRNQLINEEEKLLERRTEIQQQYYREEEALTELRRRHEISATQPVLGAQATREDPVFLRHQETRDEVERARLALLEVSTELEKKEELFQAVPEMISKEVLVEGVSIDAELRRLQTRITEKEEELEKIRRQHSQYTVIERELEVLRDRLRKMLGVETEDLTQTQLIANPLRRKLQTDIDDLLLRKAVLEDKVRQLDSTLSRSQRLVSERQDVFQEIRFRTDKINRLQETLTKLDKDYEDTRRVLSKIAGPGGNPFEITQEVEIPRKPTEPNPLLIILFSLVGGFALGIGGAVVMEFSKNCFRSVNDISRVLIAPVLGTINTIVTRRDLRRRSMRRFVVGVTTLSLIGGLVFITWAWAVNPDLLPPQVRSVIEDVRSHLQ